MGVLSKTRLSLIDVSFGSLRGFDSASDSDSGSGSAFASVSLLCLISSSFSGSCFS